MSFPLLIIALLIGLYSCSSSSNNSSSVEEPSPIKYENELFSVLVPNGWMCDSTGWKGLDSMSNVVDFYDPSGILYLHFVKVFLNIKWKNIEEATEFAKTAKILSGDDSELLLQKDSLEVGGYPASILLYANYVDNDTIIQKQFVSYLEDSHIIMYFNVNFRPQDWETAEDLGNRIISTIKLKSVMNPLDNNSTREKAIEDGIERKEIDEKYLKRGEEMAKEYERRKK